MVCNSTCLNTPFRWKYPPRLQVWLLKPAKWSRKKLCPAASLLDGHSSVVYCQGKTLGREPAQQEASLAKNRSKTVLQKEQCPVWTTSFTTTSTYSAGQPVTHASDRDRPIDTTQLWLKCFKRSLPNKETNYTLKTFYKIHVLFFLCLISSLLEAWLLPKCIQSNAWW